MSRWFGLAMVIVSGIALIGVFTFAGPCILEDGSTASCYGAAQAIIGFSIGGLICADIAIFWRKSMIKKVFSLLCAVFGILMALAPGTLFPLCMMHTMRCWTTMRPFAMVFGIVLALASVGYFLTQPKKQ